MPKVGDAHRAARRQQVLDAAAACFSRQGFHRTTMQDIVREADLSAGAVYGYFAAKEDIIEAIAAERHARDREIIRRARGLPLDETLRRLASDFVGALASPDEQSRRRVGVQIWAEALRDRRVLRLVRRGIDEPIRLLEKVIRKSQARGEIAAGLDAEAAARAMIALFHGFILQRCWDRRADLERYLGVIDAMIEALIARSRTAQPRKRT